MDEININGREDDTTKNVIKPRNDKYLERQKLVKSIRDFVAKTGIPPEEEKKSARNLRSSSSV